MEKPTQTLHDESKTKYPQLSLSDEEYVISDVRRHPIGILSVWIVETLVILVLVVLAAFVSGQSNSLPDYGVNVSSNAILGIVALVILLLLVFGWIGTVVYRSNRFFVTNESVIQYIRTGLFAQKEQIIALSGIEDASYHQNGFLQYLLNYGSIRLSTVGDETTYRFTFVANPKTELATLNDAVESFKRNQNNSSDS